MELDFSLIEERLESITVKMAVVPGSLAYRISPIKSYLSRPSSRREHLSHYLAPKKGYVCVSRL